MWGSFRCALSDGYPHPLVFAGRRKTAAPFLFRFSGGDRGNLPDQFQWSPVGLESQGGLAGPAGGFCLGLLFYFNQEDQRLGISHRSDYPPRFSLWHPVYAPYPILL